MSADTKYNLSFTGVSLKLNDMIKVARIATEQGFVDLDIVRESGTYDAVKQRTSDRQIRQLRNRLHKLTPDQISILINGDLNSQKQIAFLSVCKLYDFIRDFTIEVIRHKTIVYDYQIHESDYKTFINNKIPEHPELEALTENTANKTKQVLFHILDRSGIITKNRDIHIQPQILHPDVINAIANDDKAWLKIFMMSDTDIQQLKI